MTSANDTLWMSYDSLRIACSADTVRANNETGRLLRKGLYVTTFNLLEGFIENRWKEIAFKANERNGRFFTFHTLFTDQRISIFKHCLEVATRQLETCDSTAFTAILNSVHELSDRNGTNMLPTNALSWTTSNASPDHFAETTKRIGLDKIWERLDSIYTFTVPNETKKKQNSVNDFRDLMKLRHSAAHDFQFEADPLRLNRLPAMLLRLSLAIDIALTCSADFLCSLNIDQVSSDDTFCIPRSFTTPNRWMAALYNSSTHRVELVMQSKQNYDLRRKNLDSEIMHSIPIDRETISQSSDAKLAPFSVNAQEIYRQISSEVYRYAEQEDAEFVIFYLVKDFNYEVSRWIIR